MLASSDQLPNDAGMPAAVPSPALRPSSIFIRFASGFRRFLATSVPTSSATPNVAIKQSLNPEGCPDMQGNKDSHPEQKSKKGDATGRAQASREKRQQEKPTLNQTQSATKARAAEERERLRQEVLRLSAQLEAESLVDGKLKGVALRSFRTGVQPR